jgi:dienelactone hydrolase
MFRRSLTASGLAAITLAMPAAAQGQPPAFFYPSPPPGSVTIARDVTYGTSGDTTLKMDVYRPAKAGGLAPALIFFNHAAGPQRTTFTFYTHWAEIAAAKGLVAIVPDLRFGTSPSEFDLLLAHLVERGADYGVDATAMAVYAGSGNVSTALPTVEEPKRTAVKAAVMYYGTADVKTLRMDLPVLLVRAGLDRPGVNAGMTALAAAAVAQNAPLTLLNHPTGHHAFEIVDDDMATRAVIDTTIEFVHRATSAGYQAALRGGIPEAVAAGHVSAGRFGDAAVAYAPLVAARPDDHRLRLSYGEALLGDRQYSKACGELATLEGKGLGPRDLGLPAARACVQAGDADRAVAWLRSIPQRFLPPDVLQEPVFATLVDRADFQALFKRN